MARKIPVTPDIEEAALKRTPLLSLTLLWLTMIPPVMPAQIHFTATLNGGQEVPPAAITATGSGSFELSGDLTEIRYFVSYQGMNASDGGLYAGGTGANGALIRSLTTPSSASGTFSGVWRSSDAVPLTRALVDSLLTGRMYIELNYADPVVKGGIRGQLVLSTLLHFDAVCDGTQENPPVPTTAGGTGVFVLDESRTQLDYWVTYRGLSGTLSSGGGIGAGAPGTPGPVVRAIAPAGEPPSATIRGTWRSTDVQPLTGALIDSLIAGRLYCNFPTGANPGGEIRGQIVLRAGIGFVASMDSAQENPATPTHASGTGSFVLNDARDQLSYNLTYIGLSGDFSGFHIHLGKAGSTGVIVKTLALTGGMPEGSISGIWRTADLTEKFAPTLAESLITGKLYTDIHTSSNSGGEIRGQVNLTTGAGFTSQLSARDNVPPSVLSNGTGTASVVLSPDRQRVTYSLTYLNITDGISSAGGHFHAGARGFNGELVKLIVPPNSPDAFTVAGEWSTSDAGSQPLTPAIVDSLVAGHIYINLHTGAYIGGEIRGQVSRDFDVLTSIRELSPMMIPGEFRLEQNYPNPFNPATKINYFIPEKGMVSLKIFDVLGREVATLFSGEQGGGNYSVTFDGSTLSSGVYFYRLQAGKTSMSRKLVLVK
jgi:hypothetical protein